MQIYEAPMAHTVDFEVVNVIAVSNADTDTPETLTRWGGLVRDVNGVGSLGDTPV